MTFEAPAHASDSHENLQTEFCIWRTGKTPTHVRLHVWILADLAELQPSASYVTCCEDCNKLHQQTHTSLVFCPSKIFSSNITQYPVLCVFTNHV